MELGPILNISDWVWQSQKSSTLLPGFSHKNKEVYILCLYSFHLWFNEGKSEDQDRSVHSGTCKQKNEQSKVIDDKILEEHQAYWKSSLEEYSGCPIYCSEISSSITSAAQVYWEKERNPDKFKQNIETRKLVSNCVSLGINTNSLEIFVGLQTLQKNMETKFQEIQKAHAVSTLMLLKVASQLTSVYFRFKGNKGVADFTSLMNLIKV